MNSLHYEEERQKRERLIRTIGYGNIIKSVVVDRGHPAGPEIHKLSDTGIISIYNQRTNVLITRLIARPGQVKRYYKPNEIIPENVLKIAWEHQVIRLNEV